MDMDEEDNSSHVYDDDERREIIEDELAAKETPELEHIWKTCPYYYRLEGAFDRPGNNLMDQIIAMAKANAVAESEEHANRALAAKSHTLYIGNRRKLTVRDVHSDNQCILAARINECFRLKAISEILMTRYCASAGDRLRWLWPNHWLLDIRARLRMSHDKARFMTQTIRAVREQQDAMLPMSRPQLNHHNHNKNAKIAMAKFDYFLNEMLLMILETHLDADLTGSAAFFETADPADYRDTPHHDAAMTHSRAAETRMSYAQSLWAPPG